MVGAYYYLKIVKIMYFDAPGAPYAKARAPVETVLIFLAALIVSPLGYLLIGPLGSLTDRAAGASSEPHPHRRARPARPMPICLPMRPRSRATGWSRWRRTRAGAARAGSGSRSTAISSAARSSSCGRGDPPAPSLSLAAGLALIEAVDVAAPEPALMLKWPNDLLLDGAKLGGILLERVRRPGRRRLRRQSRRGAGDRRPADRRPWPRDHAQAFAPLLAAASPGCSAPGGGRARGVRQRLARRAHPLGTPLTVHAGKDDMVTGTFDGIEPDGALRLAVDGREQVIRAGDVHLG